jgi:hypothetical protein
MTRYVKAILSSLAVLIASASFSQKPAEHFLSQIGLTLDIPSDFTVLDTAQNEAINQKGLKLIEDANHMSVDASQTKTLIAAKKNDLNYFNVTITPYNPKEDGSYTEAVKNVNNVLYKTFHEKLPDAKIDTVTNSKNIDGLEFSEFHVKIQLNEKMTMHLFMLAKYYKGYDLGIAYLYLDDVTKNQMEDILQGCKFAK